MSRSSRVLAFCRQIALGDAAAAPGNAGLHAREDGMVSLITVIVLLFFLVLFGWVANVGLTVNQRMEVQNAADASAYSSALWMARGMNAVTATNHLMGEMLAFVALHAAITERLPDGDPKERAAQQKARDAYTSYQIAHEAVQLGRPATGTPAHDLFGDEFDDLATETGATVRAGKTDLLKALTGVYAVKTVAGFLERSGFAPTVAAGYALDGVATVVEVDIIFEWEVLTGFHQFARAIETPVQSGLLEGLLPAAAQYERLVQEAVPTLAEKAARAVAEANGSTGALFPRRPQLPLAEDPYGRRSDDRDFARCQLVRAAYPWVKYHRRPILDVLNWLKLSHAARYYVYWSNDYTVRKARKFYGDGGGAVNARLLLVLQQSDPENKGREPWTNDPAQADRLFTVVGFARRDPPSTVSPAVFGRPNAKGLVAYAQAMWYNANAQNPDSAFGSMQPDVGWDTLNWRPREEGANEAFECPIPPESQRPGRESGNRPAIKLNWQAKLVPASARVNEAARDVPGPFQSPLEPLVPVPEQFRNH